MPRIPRVLVVGAALLAGCGGGPSAEQVAREYVSSDDPAKCDDAALSLLERGTPRRGDAAREACRTAVERSDPPSGVRVVDRSVRGDRARVELEASGQVVVVELERRDDRWLVTRFGR